MSFEFDYKNQLQESSPLKNIHFGDSVSDINFLDFINLNENGFNSNSSLGSTEPLNFQSKDFVQTLVNSSQFSTAIPNYITPLIPNNAAVVDLKTFIANTISSQLSSSILQPDFLGLNNSFFLDTQFNSSLLNSSSSQPVTPAQTPLISDFSCFTPVEPVLFNFASTSLVGLSTPSQTPLVGFTNFDLYQSFYSSSPAFSIIPNFDSFSTFGTPAQTPVTGSPYDFSPSESFLGTPLFGSDLTLFSEPLLENTSQTEIELYDSSESLFASLDDFTKPETKEEESLSDIELFDIDTESTDIFTIAPFDTDHENSLKKQFPIFPCTYTGCNRQFTRHFNLKQHLKTHSLVRDRPFVCNDCGKGFLRAHDLVRHATMHTDQREWHCTKCEKGFTRKDALARHLKRKCQLLKN